MKMDSKKMCILLLGFFMLVSFTIAFKTTFEGFSNDENTHKKMVYDPNDLSDYSVKPGDMPVQVTPGFEDLYVLKSEVVPPVCPTVHLNKSKEESCPPCPPCARCPEPSFECKKVPNYNSNNNSSLPRPVLNDFSQFGM